MDNLIGVYDWGSPCPTPGDSFVAYANQNCRPDELDSSVVVRTVNKVKTWSIVIGPNLERAYASALTLPGFRMPVILNKAKMIDAEFVPGHIWGDLDSLDDAGVQFKTAGPVECDVMIVGKMPGREEIARLRNLVGPSGEVLSDSLTRAGAKDIRSWYVTNLFKFAPPDGKTSKLWLRDCMPLLWQELKLVRPKYILCLGADASKALLGDKNSVTAMEGRVVDLPLPHSEFHEDAVAKVVTVLHPVQVAREPDKQRVLDTGIRMFVNLLNGKRPDDIETDVEHWVCDRIEAAREVIAEAKAHLMSLPRKERWLSWDSEWHGRNPRRNDVYLRSLTFSCRVKAGVTFKLTEMGGEPCFRDAAGNLAYAELVELLNALAVDTRSVGHFLIADLEWFNFIGLTEVLKSFRVPVYSREVDGVETAPWDLCAAGEGGFDTAYAQHAIEETAMRGLENLIFRYTTAPRYDLPLEEWKKKKGNKPLWDGGYGMVPEHLLHGEPIEATRRYGLVKVAKSYSCYDTDVTLRAALELEKLLTKDYLGHNCWEPFWESMIVQPIILEMHENGLPLNTRRVDELTLAFAGARDRVEKEIKEMVGWPDLNLRSIPQVKELLFGEHLNGTLAGKGEVSRLRPDTARSFYLDPVQDTSKKPKAWKEIVEEGKQDSHSPSTGKVSLGILFNENPAFAAELGKLRDHRFLDQACKGFLRSPKEDEEGGYMEDEEGNLIYETGLVSLMDPDGRIRGRFEATTDSGRWRSRNPNLQNVSKTRDKDYERLLGKENYKHKMRSVFVSPPGTVLIEADYKGAELYFAGVLSGDTTMIDHTTRAIIYDEEGYDRFGVKVDGGKFPHPEYRDIHSSIAVLAFNLRVTDAVDKKGVPASEILGLPVGEKCTPNKFALQVTGQLNFRTLAKNVIFGLMYGRQAKAIALQARENRGKDDPEVTEADAQAVIDAIFRMYPRLKPYFKECQRRAAHPRFIVSCFGRRRRMPVASDRTLLGEFERIFQNFGMQSGVASALDRGAAYMTEERDRREAETGERMFDWHLTIHDAIMVSAPPKYVPYVTKKLIPWAMCEMVPIYPTRLDGSLTGTGPYHLGIDVSVHTEWGTALTTDEVTLLGLPKEYAKAH